MHRSRLSVILIDCSEDKMEAGLQFWSNALGTTVRQPKEPSGPYVALEGEADGLRVVLQRMNDAIGFHKITCKVECDQYG